MCPAVALLSVSFGLVSYAVHVSSEQHSRVPVFCCQHGQSEWLKHKLWHKHCRHYHDMKISSEQVVDLSFPHFARTVLYCSNQLKTILPIKGVMQLTTQSQHLDTIITQNLKCTAITAKNSKGAQTITPTLRFRERRASWSPQQHCPQ